MGFGEVVDVMFFVCTVQFRNETSDVRRNYADAVTESKLFGNLLHFNIIYLSLGGIRGCLFEHLVPGYGTASVDNLFPNLCRNVLPLYSSV